MVPSHRGITEDEEAGKHQVEGVEREEREDQLVEAVERLLVEPPLADGRHEQPEQDFPSIDAPTRTIGPGTPMR